MTSPLLSRHASSLRSLTQTPLNDFWSRMMHESFVTSMVACFRDTVMSLRKISHCGSRPTLMIPSRKAMSIPVWGPRTILSSNRWATCSCCSAPSDPNFNGAKLCVEPSAWYPQCGHAADPSSNVLLQIGHVSVIFPPILCLSSVCLVICDYRHDVVYLCFGLRRCAAETAHEPLPPNADGVTIPADFVVTHHGDWPAPEIFVVNTK